MMLCLEKLNSLFDKKQQKWRSKHICLYSNLKKKFFGLSQFSLQPTIIRRRSYRSVEEGEKSSAGEQIKGQGHKTRGSRRDRELRKSSSHS